MLRARQADVRDEDAERDAPRDLQRELGLVERSRRTSGSVLASVSGGPQRPARKALADRRVHAVQRQARLRPATAADRRPPPGCGSRSASAWRTARRGRIRARRSPADAPGSAGSCDRDASRSRTRAWRTGTHCSRFYALPKLLDVAGENLAESREARILLEVRARVAQRARHVLDVHRIAPARSSDSRTCRAPSGCAAAPSDRTVAGIPPARPWRL